MRISNGAFQNLVLLTVVLAPVRAGTLVWDPNPEPDVAGYRVFSGETNLPPTVVDVGNTNRFAISGVAPGKMYYFYVTAYNSAGLESSPSPTIHYSLPANTPPTITSVPDQSITANGSTTALNFTVNDAESLPANLTLGGSSSNPTLVPASGIVFGGSGSSRTVTVRPAGGMTGSAEITVSVFDGELTASTTFTLTVEPPAPDTTAPSIPQNLAARAISSTTVELTWNASSDASGIAHYRVFRNSVEIGTAASPTHTDTGLIAGASYTYTVQAVDAAGNRSGFAVAAEVTTPSDSPVDPDLWLGMRFEEAGSYALDDSPNEHDGVLMPGVTRDLAEGFGGVLDFNGSGGRVELGGLDIPGSELTIACWIRPDTFNKRNSRCVTKAASTMKNDHIWMLSVRNIEGIKPQMRLKTTSGDTSGLIGTVNLSTGVWTHVAATYDGAMMRLWVNGQPAGAKPKSGAIAQNPAVPAAIGAQPQGNMGFDGLMDDVRIYTRALTQAELQNTVAGAQ